MVVRSERRPCQQNPRTHPSTKANTGFHSDAYFKMAELKLNMHTQRGKSWIGWVDCSCSCGLNTQIFIVFGPISLIYSNWPMALYWSPVSHWGPCKTGSTCVITARGGLHYTPVHATNCLWMRADGCVLLCQFIDTCHCKLFFTRKNDCHLFYWIMRADVVDVFGGLQVHVRHIGRVSAWVRFVLSQIFGGINREINKVCVYVCMCVCACLCACVCVS